MFVLADSDALSDEVIRAVGNPVLALDVIHWLMGDEAFSGEASTEVDVPITHTRKQDVAWFYATIFLAPALVIAAGVAVTRGTRRKRKQVARLTPRPAKEVPRDRPWRSDSRRAGGARAAGGAPHLAARAERAPGAVAVIDATKADVTPRPLRGRRQPSSSSGAAATAPSSGCTRSAPRAQTKPNPHGPTTEKADAKTDEASGSTASSAAATARSSCIDQFAPMLSPRAFGVLDAAKLKELGLDAPKRKLEVTVKGDVRKYEIGQPATRPAASRSCATPRDSRVYLMPRGMLASFRAASRWSIASCTSSTRPSSTAS